MKKIINRYPSVSRDISIVVNDNVKAIDLITTIKKTGGSIVKNVEVFDIYQGEHITAGQKSVSLNIVYEDKEKTLKVEDVNPIHEKIMLDLSAKFEATQR